MESTTLPTTETEETKINKVHDKGGMNIRNNTEGERRNEWKTTNTRGRCRELRK